MQYMCKKEEALALPLFRSLYFWIPSLKTPKQVLLVTASGKAHSHTHKHIWTCRHAQSLSLTHTHTELILQTTLLFN